MSPRAAIICAFLAGLAAPAARALDLTLPANAVQTGSESDRASDFPVAVGPYASGRMQTISVSGQLSRTAWRIPGTGTGTAELIATLSEQIEAQGYEMLFRCEQTQCGGFDFRFRTLGLPEPQMHVDLGDYRYLAARKPGDEGVDYVSLLVSRSPGAGFIEITRIRPGAPSPESDGATVTVEATAGPAPVAFAADAAPIAELLTTGGRAVLGDLVFETGSSTLGSGTFDTLAQLAAYLAAHPDTRVALVGHTDAEGSLDANIALSKRRAEAVRQRLIEAHGASSGQLEAQGVGYLAPLASNQSDEGRKANRRVEVVVVSIQ